LEVLEMMLRLGLVAMLAAASWSCSGDEEQPKEPVTTEPAAATLPDQPGSETTAEKPAGEGTADAQAPAPEATPEAAPAVETSQPNTEAAAAATPAGGGDEMVVRAGALNVRKGPGTKHAVVRVLKRGEKVQAQSCKGNWCQIGESEYVSKRHIAKQ
jgi:uncharacterized protein YgiM (DUF1202 family)